MTKLHLSLLLFLNIICAFSQSTVKKDSVAILSFVDKIIIKANLDTQTDSYTIQSVNNNDLRISTNNQIRLDLSLDYEFIGASIGFSPKFIPGNNDDDLKGESSFIDYKFRFFLGNWTQELQYKKNKGYYVENTEDFNPNWIEGQDPFILLPDLKYTFYGGSTSYVLNPDFSLRNVVYNTEWQLKSAGSFVPTFKYSFSRLSGTFGDTKSYENSFSFGIAPDYYYTFVFHKHWFASLFISPALSIEFVENGDTETSINENSTHLPISLDGGIQIGYSSSKVIYGVNLRLDTTWYNEDRDTSVTNNSLFGKIYFGYRFNAPKKIQNGFNWLNNKLGI